MDMEKAIQKMFDCEDVEVTALGSLLDMYTNYYVSSLEKLGLSRPEAEAGIAHFCEAAVDGAEAGDDFTAPCYREDLIAVLAEHCREYCAMCA